MKIGYAHNNMTIKRLQYRAAQIRKVISRAADLVTREKQEVRLEDL